MRAGHRRIGEPSAKRHRADNRGGSKWRFLDFSGLNSSDDILREFRFSQRFFGVSWPFRLRLRCYLCFVRVGLCKYRHRAMGLRMEISQWLPANLHLNSVIRLV